MYSFRKEMMSAMFICGLVSGILILFACYRRIPGWPRQITLVVMVIFSIIGLTPFFLLHRGLIEGTKLTALMSTAYFIIFSVIGVVALSGKLSRAQRGVQSKRI
jgi:peptidoglycan/LPS O-acetylase OafA/YrhL